MQTLSLSFFDRQPLGRLMSRITNDTEFVALFYEQAVSQLIRAGFRIAIIVVVMFLIEWRLALVGVIIIPTMLVLTGIVVAVSATALGLALAGRIHQSHADTDASTPTEESDHGQD